MKEYERIIILICSPCVFLVYRFEADKQIRFEKQKFKKIDNGMVIIWICYVDYVLNFTEQEIQNNKIELFIRTIKRV